MHDAVGLFRRKAQAQQPVPVDRVRIEKKQRILRRNPPLPDGIRPRLRFRKISSCADHDIRRQFAELPVGNHTAAREVGGRTENGPGLPVMHDAVGLFRRKTQTQQPVPIDRIRIEKKRSDGIRPVLSRPRTGIFRPIRRIERPIAVHRETPLETGFALPQKQQRDQHQQRNQQQDPPPFAAGAGRPGLQQRFQTLFHRIQYSADARRCSFR